MSHFLYIQIEYALKLHDKIISVSWGQEWLYYWPWSVLDFIQNDNYYPTFVDKLTHLVYEVAMWHSFVDGNKRTALELWAYFIQLNYGNSVLVEWFIVTFENIVVEVVRKSIDKYFLNKLFRYFMEWNFDDEWLQLELANKLSR